MRMMESTIPPARLERNDELRSDWLVLLPLALLPFVNALFPEHRTLANVLVLFVVLITWAWVATRPGVRPTAIALSVRTAQGGRIGGWELCLLGFALTVAIIYLAAGAQVQEIATNDGAYYYGVARHMALTGRFEEPILWHFLHPHDNAVHVPFDYWGCLTTLLLVPFLWAFGATPQTAFITMSLVAAASVVAFWYLVCVALPLRHGAAQLIALAVFALSPAMDVYRFQPESTPVAHLVLLLAFIAFCRARYILAVLFGFAVFLTRGDGLLLFLLIFAAVLLEERASHARRAPGLRATLLAGLICIATYTLWSYASFGTFTSPASQRLPFLPRYWQVFDYGVTHPAPGWDDLLNRFRPAYIAGRVQLGITALRNLPFTPVRDWWLIIALAPALELFRRSRRRASLIWLVSCASYLLVAWANGPGFAPFRTPHTFAPLIALVGGMGIDTLLAGLHAALKRGAPRRLPALVAGAAVVGLCFLMLADIPVLSMTAFRTIPAQAELTKLEPVVEGNAIVSNVPWYLIAYTSSPAVSLPFNGEAAIAAVLARYHVRWMVIAGNPPTWVSGPSRAVLQGILDGKRTNIGPFQLERVSIDIQPALYRVHPPP